MASYVADKRKYVYWATPQCRDQIQLGDRAYIWRALGEGPRGIIAVGTVAELPTEYLQATLFQFKHPERLGFGEEATSSGWKTGISVIEVRLTAETGMLTAEMLGSICTDLNILRISRGTVFRVNAAHRQKIETLWANTRGTVSP